MYIFRSQFVIQNLHFLVSNEYLIFSVEGNFWSRYIYHPFYVAMGGLIGLIHNLVFSNWHHVKEHWGRGMFQTNKLYQIYELRDWLLKVKFSHRNAQLYCLGSNGRSKFFEKNYTWVLNSFQYHRLDRLCEYITKYEYYRKRYIWINV